MYHKFMMASIPEDIDSSFDELEHQINYLKTQKRYAEYALRTLCMILNYSLPGVHSIDREDVTQRIDSCKQRIDELDISIKSVVKEQNTKPIVCEHSNMIR